MAEFRKREDINQELDILQHWSDMGAPRIADVSRSLQSLVKSVDPRMIGEAGIEMTVSEEPPEFANLPPGEDEGDRSRRRVFPLIAALLLAAAGSLFMWSRWEPQPETAKSPEPSDEDFAGIPPEQTRAPSPAPTMQPSVMAVKPTPEVTMTPEATPSPAATERPAFTVVTPEAPPSPLATPESLETLGPGVPAPEATVRPQQAPPARTYTVQRGDTLAGIAARQLGDAERWNELYEANRDAVVAPDLIEPGTRLRMPEGAAAAPQSARQSYTVRPGDTLGTIAAQHLGSSDRWRDLYELNRDRLTSPDLIQPGQALRLPSGATAGAGDRRPAMAAGQTIRYVVQPGDSLSLIALKYLGSANRWQEIYYLNSDKIANPHWIYPGQVLVVPQGRAAAPAPVRYVVKTGDTLWNIAGKMYGDPTAWPRLYRANQDEIENPHRIYPGEVFDVPR